ncbi:MAG: hypothetical protein QOD12_1443 [Verrucomicrobiota bacterium]|jgi:TolB-like protein/Tfp pilus assembly protein PilF
MHRAMNPKHFFAELKRRNVIRFAGLYLVGAWLLTQVASTVLPAFDVPSWALRWLIITLALCFVPALIFSWIFELTPQGLKRDEDVAPEQSIAPQTARRMDRTLIAVLVLALGYFGFDKFVLAPRREVARRPNDSLPSNNAKSIAVLPFENLSDDKNAAYFADGIQDEILTKLAGIADLKVISRTSTAKYKSKPEDLKTVSQQLGVATVLEGSVQKAGDKVRVNVQLIDARVDSHLWAKSYDGDAKDIFAMETEVSQQVADALRARLSPAEAERLAGAPTANTEAYDLFLKGEFAEREAESTLMADDFERAAELYRRAIALDPGFALAHARLVVNRMQRHWYIDHLSAAQLQPIQDEAERALQLARNLPEAHIARGVVYYFGHRQYEEALGEFRAAIRLQPNNARASEFSGYVHRRLGRWADSLSELRKSQEQDPRNSNLLAEMAISYGYLRMWKEADEFAHRALAINPHETTAMAITLNVALNGKGDVKEARHLLGTVAEGNLMITDIAHSAVGGLIGYRAFTSMVEHDVDGALKIFRDDNTALDERLRRSARVLIFLAGGDKTAARAEAEKALSVVEARVHERPEDLDAIVQASWVYLGLDRTSEAIAMATRAANLLPPEKDALVGPITLLNLAEIECRSGQATATIEILRRLLSIPAGSKVSIPSLRINPMWDPIRNDPAFQQLLAGSEHAGP